MSQEGVLIAEATHLTPLKHDSQCLHCVNVVRAYLVELERLEVVCIFLFMSKHNVGVCQCRQKDDVLFFNKLLALIPR